MGVPLFKKLLMVSNDNRKNLLIVSKALLTFLSAKHKIIDEKENL